MTKRFLCLLAALMLALTSLPAFAEQEVSVSLPILRIYHLSEDGETAELLGCGALFLQQDLLLTALPPMKNEDTYIALGSDVMCLITEGRSLGDALQLLRLEEPSAMQPLQLGHTGSTAGMHLFGLDAEDQPVQSDPSQARRALYGADRLEALEVTAAQGMLPGAILTDGRSIGAVAAARHMDGDARYILLEADTIRSLLQDVIVTQEAPAELPWISHQVSLKQEGCFLSVDWSQLDLDLAPDDQVWTLMMADGNCYYESYGADPADGVHVFQIVPGLSYMVWAFVGPQKPSLTEAPSGPAVFDSACGEFYSDYAYADEWFYLGISEPGQTVDAEHPADALADITCEALLDAEHLWLQAVSTYQVEEEVTYLGCVAMITPEGYTFSFDIEFVLVPELAQRDVWAFPLADLLTAYQQFGGGPVPGEYTMLYYFGDQPVNRLDFVAE